MPATCAPRRPGGPLRPVHPKLDVEALAEQPPFSFARLPKKHVEQKRLRMPKSEVQRRPERAMVVKNELEEETLYSLETLPQATLAV